MPTHTELLMDTKLTDTKLLFGLRTNQQVTLTVVGQPGSQAECSAAGDRVIRRRQAVPRQARDSDDFRDRSDSR